MCVLLLGLLLCWRHDCCVVCLNWRELIESVGSTREKIGLSVQELTGQCRGEAQKRQERGSEPVIGKAGKIDGSKKVANGLIKRYGWRVVGWMVTARERSDSFGPTIDEVQDGASNNVNSSSRHDCSTSPGQADRRTRCKHASFAPFLDASERAT